MKSYPSIEGIRARVRRDELGVPCVAFYKYDGSNIRAEWSRKRGWYKFGTRKVMIDRNTEFWGQVVDLWAEQLADPVERVIRDAYPKAESVVAFAEFFGDGSFAGQHDNKDPKTLRLIDVNIHKKGFIDPVQFIKDFPFPSGAEVVYQGPLDLAFIAKVREDKCTRYEGYLDEGVVCKGGSGHKLWMTKIKTDTWIQRIKAAYPLTWADLHDEADEVPAELLDEPRFSSDRQDTPPHTPPH